jgi:hypothetical protein
MTDVPSDPLGNDVSGLWTFTSSSWSYAYLVSKRNWADKAWFVLMAQTEVAWGSNWVYCGASSGWAINPSDDLAQVHPCSSIEKTTNTCSNSGSGGSCQYSNESQLRYIVLY